jgi:hypothetical protein
VPAHQRQPPEQGARDQDQGKQRQEWRPDLQRVVENAVFER